MLQAKTKSEEKKRVSEPDSDMIQVLELLDWEFKITTINMVRGLQKKTGHHARTGRYCKQRNEKNQFLKKESKGNTLNQKHCNVSQETL